MNQFAEQGLISDVSDVWPIDGISDSFKEASTASDGKQYFVPKDYYPWAVFYQKSVCEKRGYAPPATFDELDTLMKKMQSDGLAPFAFADKDGWPAMGTFDILNMRINGFDFHMSLMAGEEEWDSTEVKQVFDTWRGLLPYHQEDPLGRTWQEAATSMGKEEAGMYLLGTFVVDAIPDLEDDLDFFTFPELDARSAPPRSTPRSTASASPRRGDNQEGGKEMLKFLGTAEAADAANAEHHAVHRRQRERQHRVYSALQKKSAEVVGAATEHRAVPRPRHPLRLRLDGDDPVAPAVPGGPRRHRRRDHEHPGAEGVDLRRLTDPRLVRAADLEEARTRRGDTNSRPTSATPRPGRRRAGGSPRGTGSWSS